MRQYFETFVRRNPLIRDEILFLALFRGANQVYLLRYKHANSATIFLLWHAGLFTRRDLDRNSCAYNLRTFEFKHFGITWIITRLYSFKFLINCSPTRNKSPNDCTFFWWCAVGDIFFPYPFLDYRIFLLILYFTLKINQNLLFFQMRMWGESNPRPIIISQTTEPLDQQGMSCQTSDFNPW